MALSDEEAREIARALDARWFTSNGTPTVARCLTCGKQRHRQKLRIITGDRLSAEAMRIAKAYDTATPLQRQCMDAIAAVALGMQGDASGGVDHGA